MGQFQFRGVFLHNTAGNYWTCCKLITLCFNNGAQIGGATVVRTTEALGSAKYGFRTGAFTDHITFTGSAGRNVPLLQADTLDLDKTATVTAAVVTTGGGSDLFYNPIPAEFFEVATTKPNAVIVVNGINAECATNRDISSFGYDITFDPFYSVDPAIALDCKGDPNKAGCKFEYSAADCTFKYEESSTPKITKVTTSGAGNDAVAGDEVTIEGTGFTGQYPV